MKAARRPLILSGILILISLLALGQSVPELIAYQGRLTNAAGIPLDSVTVDLTFAFYPTELSGTPLLTVTQPGVPVIKGIYNVLIGSGGILPGTETTLAGVFQNHAEVWMGVQVNSDPEMTPRARITSVAFALKAEKAEKADRVDTRWLTAFMQSNDFDQDGYLKNNDCDDGNASVGPPSCQKLGSDLQVTSAASNAYDPSLAWTGTEFGASWTDYRDGNTEIYFARISSSGAKLGSDLRVTSAASSSYSPSLSWTGTEFGVSWTDNRDGNEEIYFARLSSSGDKLGSDLRVTSDASYSYIPSLAWTGSEFGVSWQDGRDGNYEIYFARVSSSGAKLGADLRVTSDANGSYRPSLAWTGSEFGVSWYDNQDGNEEIYFARLSSSGSKLGADLRVTSDAGSSYSPSLAWTGSEFGVSWTDYDYLSGYENIYFAWISSSGSKLGSNFQVTSDPSYGYSPYLAWTGSEFGVSWTDYREVNDEIYFARIAGVCP